MTHRKNKTSFANRITHTLNGKWKKWNIFYRENSAHQQNSNIFSTARIPIYLSIVKERNDIHPRNAIYAFTDIKTSFLIDLKKFSSKSSEK